MPNPVGVQSFAVSRHGKGSAAPGHASRSGGDHARKSNCDLIPSRSGVPGFIAASSHTFRKSPRPRPARAALLLLALSALLATARATFRDDVGYTKLQNELGGAMPTGIGIGVSQCEAPISGTYLPDVTSPEFSGKMFTVISPAGGVSGHATTVAQNFYGSATSVAPGVTDIHCYEANNWLQSGFLKYGTASAPLAEIQAVQNCSWIGSAGTTADAEILRRFDYAIEQSGFLGVVALNNGPGSVPSLLASCYNGISVGLSNRNHSYGTTTVDGAGRTKPEIVAPSYATSYGTPMVASATAMLRQVAPGDAARPVTMKAILMAGATKSQFPSWSRTTHPLDPVYGAGQLNVYNSYHILAAGQQAASTSATVNRMGWDWNATTSGSRLYFFDIPANGTSSLSAILTWNRTISSTLPDPSWGSPSSDPLPNLTLKLYAASGFTVGTLVDSSANTVDNVEHVWQATLSPGRYAMEVTADAPGIHYGLAWYSVPTVTIAATTPDAAEMGAVPGTFTITRGGPTTAPLTVGYMITGTATNATDYASIPANVTIPAGASSATVTVTPVPDTLAEGDETVVLTLSPDPTYTFSAQTNATVTIHDKPMDAWRFSKFTTAELAVPSLSGDLADFDRDGLANLHEYAFALAPKTPDVNGLPTATIQPGGARAIAYTHVKSATDITYLVEVSNDLATWRSGPSYTSVTGTVDHGATETVTAVSLLAPDATQRQFMRVRITRP